MATIKGVKIMKQIIAIALLTLTANAFAGGEFPAGTYKNGDDTLNITASGDYEATIRGYKYSGFHLARQKCWSAGMMGSLKVVDKRGNSMCYDSSMHGSRLIIETLRDSVLSGIWIKQ